MYIYIYIYIIYRFIDIYKYIQKKIHGKLKYEIRQ